MVKLNPKKMKVAELKSELEARDIQMAKGLKKADLIVLLTSALEEEGDGDDVLFSEEDADASLAAESDTGAGDESLLAETEESTPAEQPESEQIEENAEAETESYEEPAPVEEEPIQEPEPETAEEPVQEPETAEEPVQEPETVEEPVQEPEEEMETEESAPEIPIEPAQEQMENGHVEAEPPTALVNEPDEVGSKPDEQIDGTPDEGIGSAPSVEDSVPSSVDPTPPAVDDSVPQTEEDPSQATNQESAEDKPATDNVKPEDETKPSTDEHRAVNENKDKEKHERSQDGRRSENDHGSRKRRHDDRDRDRHRRYEERYAPPPEEPEEEFDDSLVVLDKYNSDLNMKLHRDRLTGQPLSLEGFAYLWAGARATYGVKAGKVCYECRLKEEHSVRQVPSSEPHRHLVRLGWSPNMTSLLVGEDELSYAYCGTGKSVTNKTVVEYGETFKEGDVIGCYLDLSDDENATMTFTKNGTSLGVAFTVEKEKLADAALFPHVLGKNTTLEMNFGEKEEPFYPHPEGLEDYVFIASVPLEERTRGTVGATARKDCEVLMLIGLPGSGKTHWANKHVAENPEKNYSILGTSSILDRMKISGIESKAPQEVLMIQASSCLNRLSQVACRKKRNFILDQTNVYSSAQRRRMRTFEGYQRKAIVIVPSKEEFKIRVEKRTKEEGKDIPDVAMYEMKANFNVPDVGDLFEEVLYIDSEKEAVGKVIEEYREEARKKGPPPEKRFRGGFEGGRGGRGGWGGFDNRNQGGRPPFRGGGNFGRFGNQRGGGGGGGGGGFRDGGDNRRGGWNNKGGGGNWQQNRNAGGGRGGGGGGGFHGGNRGNYGGGGNRSGGYNNQNRNSGNNNRNQGNRSNYQQNNRSNYSQNRSQNRGGSGGSNVGHNRGGGANASANSSYQHEAYQQQAAQFSSQTNQNPMAQQQYQQNYSQQQQQQQPDYSQQWAQYYQQQAAVQQQQAAVAAQYQNYYANYQNAYAGQQAPQPPQ